jgi:hypothetical protein
MVARDLGLPSREGAARVINTADRGESLRHPVKLHTLILTERH